MAGYVNTVRAIVCSELPAREASNFCDLWKLTSCDFIPFISSLIELNFFFNMCLLRINLPNNVSKYDSFWCSGFQWMSLWRSDKFLLTLSLHIQQRNFIHCHADRYTSLFSANIFHCKMVWNIHFLLGYLWENWKWHFLYISIRNFIIIVYENGKKKKKKKKKKNLLAEIEQKMYA